jgi:N-acetylglucosamine transport system permease protein
MLSDADKFLKTMIGQAFLLNNHVVVSVIYAATALPFTIYLLTGYFATLPHDFEEAAYMDGAGYGKTMLKIMFPMAKPAIITVILIITFHYHFLSGAMGSYHSPSIYLRLY